ncbi:hypothetical protein O6H91_20G020100 [Diphasiastrum complanatum]|uniref:Uncharacterized protein n=1 Tax=Diphasiastrum complanatum TaxID=34168 RepID=A0ACC2ANE8_DIPCM|nr:hypothetical protein O6H91_20G020100 [Diphasiastrum complanatum]
MSNQEGGDGNAPSFTMADLAAALPPGSGALSAADRAGLVHALKDKLQHLAGQSAYLESLSPEVKKRVTVLQELQHQHDEVEAKFRQEKAALEAKYQKLYEPFYTKRSEIVSGVVDVEENKSGTPETTAVEEKDEKGVPEFWLTAMKTNEVLAMQITERDEGALKYLKDIKCYTLDNPKGFRLDFIFETNPFFRNTVLSKTYHMVDDDEPILERAIGTEIEWSPGKNLTQKVLKKKPKKGDKNVKPVTKTAQCDSFFNFFSPPQVPDDDDDIDQDEAEQLQDAMEQDYDIGSTLKDKIIPHAVSWFTGEALQGEEFDDDEEEEDDEEDDDEDEEDEDDEEEEDDEEDVEEVKSDKKNATSLKQKGTAAQQGGEQPPECKQQ